MYVTLEPCAHQGRQPPCVEAILEAGIARVVIASDDPSEKAAGRGPGILRDGGVEVEFAAGEEAAAARLLNQPFRKHARTGLPLVTLKLAMSLDGRTATAPGDSPWISGEQSRALVHRWRAESDAIAVGIGTVLADDPLLTARRPVDAPIRQSDRTDGSRFASSSTARPACRSTRSCCRPSTSRRCRGRRVPGGRRGRVAPCATPAPRSSSPTASTGRSRRPRPPRHHQPLPRGRPTLAAAFADADQIDEARIFVAPVLLGGASRGWRGGRAERRSPGPADRGPAQHRAKSATTP